MSEENKDSKDDLELENEGEEETNMLHESAKAMKTGQFSIQILKAEPGVVILAEREEGGENYVIELPEEQVPIILSEFGGDFASLAQNLEVMNK